jgi:hypothetical protein
MSKRPYGSKSLPGPGQKRSEHSLFEYPHQLHSEYKIHNLQYVYDVVYVLPESLHNVFLTIGTIQHPHHRYLKPWTLRTQSVQQILHLCQPNTKIRALQSGNTLICVIDINKIQHPRRMIPININVMIRDLHPRNPVFSQSFSSILMPILHDGFAYNYLFADNSSRVLAQDTSLHDEFIAFVLRTGRLPEPGTIDFLPFEQSFINDLETSYGYQFTINEDHQSRCHFINRRTNKNYMYLFRTENERRPSGLYLAKMHPRLERIVSAMKHSSSF